MPKKNENSWTKGTRPNSRNSIAELVRHLDAVLDEAERVKEMLTDVDAQLQREGFVRRGKKESEL